MENNPYAATAHTGDETRVNDADLSHLSDEEWERINVQSKGIIYTEVYFGIFAFWAFFTTVLHTKAPVFDFIFGMGFACWFGFAIWLSRRRRWPGLLFGLLTSVILVIYGLLWIETSKFGYVHLIAGAWGCVNFIASRHVFKKGLPRADELSLAKLSRSLAKSETQAPLDTD